MQITLIPAFQGNTVGKIGEVTGEHRVSDWSVTTCNSNHTDTILPTRTNTCLKHLQQALFS